MTGQHQRPGDGARPASSLCCQLGAQRECHTFRMWDTSSAHSGRHHHPPWSFKTAATRTCCPARSCWVRHGSSADNRGIPGSVAASGCHGPTTLAGEWSWPRCWHALAAHKPVHHVIKPRPAAQPGSGVGAGPTRPWRRDGVAKIMQERRSPARRTLLKEMCKKCRSEALT